MKEDQLVVVGRTLATSKIPQGESDKKAQRTKAFASPLILKRLSSAASS